MQVSSDEGARLVKLEEVRRGLFLTADYDRPLKALFVVRQVARTSSGHVNPSQQVLHGRVIGQNEAGLSDAPLDSNKSFACTCHL